MQGIDELKNFVGKKIIIKLEKGGETYHGDDIDHLQTSYEMKTAELKGVINEGIFISENVPDSKTTSSESYVPFMSEDSAGAGSVGKYYRKIKSIAHENISVYFKAKGKTNTLAK
jgi:hypothetical protein